MSIINTFHFITSHPLTQDQKILALWRFVKWQFFSRFIFRNGMEVPFVEDSRLFVKSGMTGATGNIYCGLHEFEDMSFLLHFLTENDLFVDIGANVGTYTVLASAVVHAKSIAYEPIDSTYQMLNKNIKINNIQKNTESYQYAIGDNNCYIEMTADKGPMNHILIDNNYEGEKVNVPVRMLDSEIKNKVPCMIKIDVEGYESDVIKGGMTTLANEGLKAVLLELNFPKEKSNIEEFNINKIMLDFGFNPYKYDPFSRKLLLLKNLSDVKHNILYLRDIEYIKASLLQTPKFYVLGQYI